MIDKKSWSLGSSLQPIYDNFDDQVRHLGSIPLSLNP